jgi:acyl-homoserine lactone acylase PvdQ
MGTRAAKRSLCRAIAAIGAATALGTAPAAFADVPPYGAHDAGGFRNVLPPGEKGVDNITEFGEYQANGTYPEHWIDQQPLYDNLIQGSPHLTNSGIRKYYKDATFGVRDGQVESTTTPRPGVTILRDKAFGIPHVYGQTRADTMFGAGYANAQDRLFLMDILRHTGRAQLSSFVGGSPSNRQMDHDQWALAPYTEQELQQQLDLAGQYYGHEGEQLVADAQAYVDGINAYITDALANPMLMPAEYTISGKTPQMWEPTDLIAEASLIGGIFGRGGGREVDSAQTMQAFVDRFGARAGRRAWKGFRSKNDPEAAVTVHHRFPYETTNAFAKKGLALPDRGSVESAPVAPPPEKHSKTASASGGLFSNVGAQLEEQLNGPPHASNWELISARESKTGHPIGVLGPQVGYYVPQILMEEDLHGPGIDAEGATFPGVGLYVLLGHGRDYAWSATTATSDNTDTFAEVLCQDSFHYRYKGQCLPMEELDRTNSWTPNALDQTPPGSETLKAYRTVHGIVYARGKVDGKDVAFVHARASYRHEADSAIFFNRMNNPKKINGPKSFFAAAKMMNLVFNWSYIDFKHIAYHLTGWFPRRAPGTSPDFPILGTGKYDWKGWKPATNDADWFPFDKQPHVVDPRYLVSWNNKQAPGWAAADDQYGFGPFFRSDMIKAFVQRSIRGSRKASLADLVQSMEEPATQDIRAVKLLPTLLRAIGHPHAKKLQNALASLRHWRASGGHRRDLDQDGQYEHQRAIEIMDAWWPKIVHAEFQPALGKKAFDRLHDMIGFNGAGGPNPGGPDFSEGWWTFTSKDLRDLFGPRPKGAWSRTYCGNGSRQRCRHDLQKTLRDALHVSPEELYGYGDCENDPTPLCWDQNRSTIASGISIDPRPFQNRPTFQQAVSIKHDLP